MLAVRHAGDCDLILILICLASQIHKELEACERSFVLHLLNYPPKDMSKKSPRYAKAARVTGTSVRMRYGLHRYVVPANALFHSIMSLMYCEHEGLCFTHCPLPG